MSPNRQLKDLAKLVAAEMKAGTPGTGLQLAVSTIDRMPDVSLELIENIVNEFKKKKLDRGIIESLIILLGHSLETLRFSVERRRPEALNQVEAIQKRMIDLFEAEDGDISHLMAILPQFSIAKLDISEQLREVIGRKLEAQASRQEDLGTLEDHLQEVANVSEDEFDLFSHLNDFSASLPFDQRAKFSAASLTMKIEMVREAAMGWLLDPMKEVRAAIVATIDRACAQADPSQNISGTMLRRLIMARNWVPEAERPAIDQAVKSCRKNGIVVSPLRPTQIQNISVSGWDGSGAQSIFVVIREGRKFGIASVLLKQSMGVRDAWIHHKVTRKHVDDMLAEVDFQAGLMSSTQEYLTLALAHGLATNAATESFPPSPNPEQIR